VPTGLVQWGNQHGPFPELASFPLAVRDTSREQSPVIDIEINILTYSLDHGQSVRQPTLFISSDMPLEGTFRLKIIGTYMLRICESSLIV
jgi:hypothetical protein